MKKIGNLLWGLVFIILGVLWGLKAFNLLEIHFFFKGWWTLFILVPCFIGLFTEKEKTGNLVGIFIGVFLLLMCQEVVSFAFLFKLFVPMLLVVLGLSLVFKDVFSQKIKKEMKKLENREAHEYCATFSNQNLNFDGEEFEGCKLTSVFGGIKCNLLTSKLKENAYIKATSIFGGIEIKVPQDVVVKVVSTAIFGGVSNKKDQGDGKKVLYVEATCLFGGVDIK